MKKYKAIFELSKLLTVDAENVEEAEIELVGKIKELIESNSLGRWLGNIYCMDDFNEN